MSSLAKVGFVCVTAALAQQCISRIEAQTPKASEDKVAKTEPVVLTPAEAMRLADGKKATVEFKVKYVVKSILVKTGGGKDAGWATGHGPEDISLRSAPVKERKGAIFEAILTTRAIKQLDRAEIKDVAEDYLSKTVRVTGKLSWSHYDGFGTPPILEVVIDDRSQLEVVD